MRKGKIIVVSAPSGTGKSTIINKILDSGEFDLHFSVSATNRQPRQGEEPGVSYHFMSTEDFRQAIVNGDFVEWEQVYPGRYYGTLKSEISKKCAAGHNLVLDIDVKGALNVKKIYGGDAKTIFIKPPSIEALQKRLEHRGTEAPEIIAERVGRAEYELSLAPEFDTVIVNDDLDTAVENTRREIGRFLGTMA